MARFVDRTYRIITMSPSPFQKLFFISILSSNITATLLTQSYSQCLDDKKSLLLELKSELIFDSSISQKLVQWNQTDECCNWQGVECDGSGNIISLELDGEGISGGIGNSSALFRLEYLEKLNLAYNYFKYTQIPKGIHNLSYLTHLNLSNAYFGGQVPVELSSLRRLVSLDISTMDSHPFYPIKLEFPNLEMLLQNLTELRVMHLDGVDISSQKSEWSRIISLYTPHLRILSMRYCGLSGPLDSSLQQLLSLLVLRLDGNNLSTAVPEFLANFSSLTTLTLQNCNLKGTLPQRIFLVPSLQYLRLSKNRKLTGVLPPFIEAGTFISLDLSYCNFTGFIPATFGNQTQLVLLDLSNNFFTGSISSTLFSGLSNLVSLDLGSNSFTGNIPQSLFALPSLRVLYLNNNQFTGPIEEFPIVNVSNISFLDLSNNQLEGPIPSWFWGVGTQLHFVNLSSNLLTGLQKPFHFPTSLDVLDLSSNQLQGELYLPISQQHVFNPVFLSLANNNLSGSIPISLCNATQLYVLDLSRNKLSGTIPPCLLQNLEYLQAFNIGRNNISGHIPDSFSPNCNLGSFDINNNTIEGKIPPSLENCMSLEFMNVGNNLLNDSFPCLLSSSLRVLVLHSNRFRGEVTCLKSWPDIQIIDISSNTFRGSLESINFSSWKALGSEGQMRYNRAGLDYLKVSTYNDYQCVVTLNVKGTQMELVKIWPDFTSIDFSSNNFDGEIPDAIGDLVSLYLLNLSHNGLTGTIPKSFGNLKQLGSLDLSTNQLKGNIPEELAGLNFLSELNLSYNKLAGMIPKGSQFQTFPADSFQGNLELCGFPLNISCSSTGEFDNSPTGHENQQSIEWEYVYAAVGYVVGLGSFVWFLLLCPRFRVKYFGKIEEVVHHISDGINRKKRRVRREFRRQ